MSRRAAFLAGLLVLGLAVGLPAERIWMGNRGGTSLDFFDTVTDLMEGSVVVGSGPVDVCADYPESTGPLNLLVANASSNSVSLVRVGTAPGVIATLTGGGTYGTFTAPSGLHRAWGGLIVLVDQKLTTAIGFGGVTTVGRSTIRLFDPRTFLVIDSYRDESDTALYSDVVTTTNGRIWVADLGDGGVTVMRTPNGPAPWSIPKTLVYQGSGEFADFVHDPDPVPTYLVSPRRLATNGSTRVVVADGGSDVVTILDADYPAGAEVAAILANIDLGLAPGEVCTDVEIVGNVAYVTGSMGVAVHRIDLTTLAPILPPFTMAFVPGGLGATSDGLKLYVGNSAGTNSQAIDLVTPALGPVLPATHADPFAMYSSLRNVSESTATTGGSGWVSTSNSGSPGESCGLLGVEVLLLLGALALRRRA
jgi:hypothetical protein